MDVRFQCMGCGHKMDTAEHMRNLTTEKFMLEGVEHTMTVILCDTCKPVYDRIRVENNDVAEYDAFSALAAMEAQAHDTRH